MSNKDSLNRASDNFFIPSRYIKCNANMFLDCSFTARRCVFTDLLSMLDFIGTAPDHLTRRAGDAPIMSPAFRTNQKATQYIMLTVPGGLPLVSIFIYVAAFSLVNLNGEVILEANDIANILRVGQKLANCRSRPSFLPNG